jgi:hypothetical protein
MKGNRVSGPEGSVDIFLSTLGKEFFGQLETETNCYAQRCENSKENLFFKRSKMNEWKLVIIIIIIIISFNCKWVSTRWQSYYNKTQHTIHTLHKMNKLSLEYNNHNYKIMSL